VIAHAPSSRDLGLDTTTTISPLGLLYHAGQHYRLRIPAFLVVVTNDPEVAAWAAGPFNSGMVSMRPLVIGPTHVPVITDPVEAKRSLERTFLSGLLHADEPVAVDIGLALAAALDSSPDDVGLYYWDSLLAALGESLRSTLEMNLQHWKPRSDWGKRFLAERERECEATGEARGEAKGRVESILELLEGRGLAPDPTLRERITACTDLDVLGQWFRRATTAVSTEEVFAP
jgi:hypothetical protein